MNNGPLCSTKTMIKGYFFVIYFCIIAGLLLLEFIHKGSSCVLLEKDLLRANIISIPPDGKAQVSNHFPVPTKRVPSPNDYYFPIGWSLWLHDNQVNIPSGKDYKKDGTDGYPLLSIIEQDWYYGLLSKLQAEPWNTVYCIARKGYTGDNNAITTQNQYLSFLQDVGNHTHTLKALPTVQSSRHWHDHMYFPTKPPTADPNIDKIPTPWQLLSPIGWTVYGIIHTWDYYDSNLRTFDSNMANMISAVNASSSALAGLGGWMLADEPYGGDASRQVPEDIPNETVEISYTGTIPPETWFWEYPTGTYNDLVTTLGPPYPFSGSDGSYTSYGSYYYPNDPSKTNKVRDDVYYRLKYINSQLQTVWDQSNDHPIHCVIRSNGNYLPESTHPQENKSARISSVLHDDHYLWYDVINPRRENNDFNEEPDARWRDSAQMAIDNLISSSLPPDSLVNWFDGEAHEKDGSKWVAPDEDLRYMVYSSIVHGTRGVMFWFLSKSEQEAYAQSEKIGYEVKKMVPYLLTTPSSAFSETYLTTSQHGTNDVDFLIRLHPTNSNKALLIIVNQSNNEIPAIWITFPSTWQISNAESIIPSYEWSKEFQDINGDGKYEIIGIGASDWWARAFIITKAN